MGLCRFGVVGTDKMMKLCELPGKFSPTAEKPVPVGTVSGSLPETEVSFGWLEVSVQEEKFRTREETDVSNEAPGSFQFLMSEDFPTDDEGAAAARVEKGLAFFRKGEGLTKAVEVLPTLEFLEEDDVALAKRQVGGEHFFRMRVEMTVPGAGADREGRRRSQCRGMEATGQSGVRKEERSQEPENGEAEASAEAKVKARQETQSDSGERPEPRRINREGRQH